MKTLIWTKADAKRAEKMGWLLFKGVKPVIGFYYEIRFFASGPSTTPFTSDREACEWVILRADTGYVDEWRKDMFQRTCRKAILLCCLGGGGK